MTSSILAARFGASFEQVAHRLTTLARPTARGVPFFLLRVDIAGNVSKRFSSSRFPFANSGGTCPLWNIHATFAEPGKILTQVDRTDRRFAMVLDRPDGAPLDHPMGCDRAALCDRAWLRDQICAAARLCQAARSQCARRGADRHQLPSLRSPRLPAARRAAGPAPARRRRIDAQHLALHIQGRVRFMPPAYVTRTQPGGRLRRCTLHWRAPQGRWSECTAKTP